MPALVEQNDWMQWYSYRRQQSGRDRDGKSIGGCSQKLQREQEQEQEISWRCKAARQCGYSQGGEETVPDSRHLAACKPPAAKFQGFQGFQGFQRSKWRLSCSRFFCVLVLIHVFATGLAAALPLTIQHPPSTTTSSSSTTTTPHNPPTNTVTDGFPVSERLLLRRHQGIGDRDIKKTLRPRFDTAFPKPRITPLVTTYSPQYYHPKSIDTDTVAPFFEPTMTVLQKPLSSFDSTKALTIENPAPPILSAASDSKTFPLKNIPRPQGVGAPFPGIAIKPLKANVCSDPISTDAPPAMFKQKLNYPVPRSGVTNMDTKPVGTNKFWQHLTIGDGTLGVWTQPYMVWVNKDKTDWGLSISQTDLNQMSNGPDPNANPVQYFISPLGLRSLSLSAAEFNPTSSSMTTEQLQSHSGILHLWPDKSKHGTSKYLTVPLVQGMGFVSGYYWNLQPIFNSVILVRTLTYVGYVVNTPSGSPKIQKWRVTLEDGKIWMIYATAYPGSSELTLSLSGNTRIQATSSYYGLIQVAKLPPNTASGTNFESVLDSTAGAMPMSASFSSSVNGSTGSYSFNFARSANNTANGCLMYALPHHVASFDKTTSGRVVPGMRLHATTKGMMTAVVSDSWTLVEQNIPNGIAWLPGNVRNFGRTAMATIRASCTTEIADDINSLSNQISQYYAGKALARYAQIVLVACDVLKDRTLASQGLAKLIAAFNRFATNTQQQPLVYETTWKGVISSAPGSGDDFGNAWYNDHMFHYGYFIMAAAILVHIDQTLNSGHSSWLDTNKNYVNTLVRDVANPSDQDPYFPVSRNFDFFHGHSWATGLFPRGDGKDLESTSEDCMFSYGMKLWGNIIGDANMEARGNLMLAIQKRSLNSYFYMTDKNTIQPPNFIKNKVTGILFENKVDHATYFSPATYCIEGIHMLPLIPTSPYIKDKQFSLDEWNYYFANTVNTISNGWEGILWANAAIFAPMSSWNFFADPNFSKALLDDGASRTWYLVFAAGLGGAPAN